jgi:L-ascorbate metabolism protein UlaG (beta-lactamase superfamily)
MGPTEAAQAADWIQAGCVVPIHFDTFPAIQQDSEAFIQALGHTGIRGNRLVPGEVMLLEKNE